MKENPDDVLTVAVFRRLLTEALTQFRADFGAEIKMYIDDRFEKFEDKIDRKLETLSICKADKSDVLVINKRLVKVEERVL